MSTPARPNFFLLLDLDPQAAWDQVTFEQRLRQKRIEWSRQSGGVARKALVARQNLALISKIREVMADPLLREREAAMALAELAAAHQAACEQFEKQLALLNAKDDIEPEEVERFIAAFQHLYSPEEIRARLHNVSANRGPGNAVRIFDATMARSIVDRLNFLRLRTLYELLQLSDKSATAVLYRAAEQLYTHLVALQPTVETTARMELAGLACEVFKAEETRISYDEYLRQESFSRLFKDLEESVRRSTRQELHQGQVQIFLEQARKEGWTEQEALAKLNDQARQHRWTILSQFQYPQTDRKNEAFGTILPPAVEQHSVYPGKPNTPGNFALGGLAKREEPVRKRHAVRVRRQLPGNALCPFCFHTFALHEMPFRCMMPTCAGRAADTVYAQARGAGKIVMGRVITPARRSLLLGTAREATCESCKTVSHTRLCPQCHFELPYDVGMVEQRMIAIIGGRATGKTHYIATLVTRLQQEIGGHFGFTMRMLGDHTLERWERDFYTPLFIRKTILPPTPRAELDPQVREPLILRLTFENEGRRRVLNISFFDTAGEDMGSLNTMSFQNRSITHADGVIFLLDPLQIPAVRQQMPPASLLAADVKSSPEHLVGRLRDLFERERALYVTQKVETPVAFTLSKMDALFPLLGQGAKLYHPGVYDGYLDLDDAQSVHTEIANYLAAWINLNFRVLIDSGFARYSYFGVSALGEQPGVDNRVLAVSPLRVEDPFLWILYQLGFIKGKNGNK